MPSKLQIARNSAFNDQSGRCHYCGVLMWQGSPANFARAHGISVFQARAFRCTAEHLQARSNGGKNFRTNIVAACWWCNSRRHRPKLALDPVPYKAKVTTLVQAGRGIYRLAIDAGLFKAQS
jgi:hypothetical protein